MLGRKKNLIPGMSPILSFASEKPSVLDCDWMAQLLTVNYERKMRNTCRCVVDVPASGEMSVRLCELGKTCTEADYITVTNLSVTVLLHCHYFQDFFLSLT